VSGFIIGIFEPDVILHLKADAVHDEIGDEKF
jgi:hypothetical protein